MTGRRGARAQRGRPPWALVPLAALTLAFLLVPFAALLQRAPWSGLIDLLREPVVTEALRLSLVSACLATILSLIGGVPLAWMLARTDFPGRSLVRALVVLPMVLPPVVGGAALLFAFGRRGLVGGPVYDGTGFLLPYSLWGVVAANTFVHHALVDYVVRIVTATREPEKFGMPDAKAWIAYGASPRASLGIIAASRALALIRGRDYVVPQDVVEVIPDVLRHRLVLTYDALADEVSAETLEKEKIWREQLNKQG